MKIVTFSSLLILLTLTPIFVHFSSSSAEIVNEPAISLNSEPVDFSLSFQETTSFNLLRTSEYFHWSTYFGGSSEDWIKSVKTDSQNNIILVGVTLSNDFPVLNGLNVTLTYYNSIFLVKFDPSGTLIWSTYFG